ncbi:MAG: PEP-CTERM sorting domain-containing protein [Roseibacillus sp.]
MSHLTSLYSLLGLAVLTSHGTAALIWSESFPDADGAAVDRAITTTSGAGQNLDVTGTVSYAGGSIVIDPDGGSDRIELESTTGTLVGNFTFDAFRVEDDPLDPGDTANATLFVQMVDGAARSTNGNPVPNFADNLNMTTIVVSTTINYYFNVSGAAIDYTAPDGSTDSLANNSYELWIGNSKSGGNDQNVSGQGEGPPTSGVDTLVLQTFNAQTGGTYTIDNISFNSIPEPSGTGLLAICAGLGLVRRRRV